MGPVDGRPRAARAGTDLRPSRDSCLIHLSPDASFDPASLP